MSPYERAAISMCPAPSQSTVQALMSQYDDVRLTVGAHNKKYVEELRQQTAAFYSEEAIMQRAAIAAEYNGTGNFDHSAIYTINTLEAARGAQGNMRHFIMSVPAVRKAYDRGEVEGYAGLYEYPAEVPKQPLLHPVYATVTDGKIVGGKLQRYYSTRKMDLSAAERTALLNTADAVTQMLRDGDDPTQMDV